MPEAKKYYVGDLAYFDSFSGLIPCKVIRVEKNNTGLVNYPTVSAKVTGKKNIGPYRNGEIVRGNQLSFIPRDRVRVRSGQYRIIGNWQWVESEQ